MNIDYNLIYKHMNEAEHIAKAALDNAFVDTIVLICTIVVVAVAFGYMIDNAYPRKRSRKFVEKF